MSIARKVFGLIISGALVGALLAAAAPPTAAYACRCDDDGKGNYKCNGDQTACVSGSEVCYLRCAE